VVSIAHKLVRKGRRVSPPSTGQSAGQGQCIGLRAPTFCDPDRSRRPGPVYRGEGEAEAAVAPHLPVPIPSRPATREAARARTEPPHLGGVGGRRLWISGGAGAE
jgi:hypothetical protein